MRMESAKRRYDLSWATVEMGLKTVMKTTRHRYIATNDEILSGEPIIAGTRTPVRAIVELWRLGAQPEVIQIQLPHLTLSQIFDALSYYSDHQTEINLHIERNRIPDDLLDPLTREE
jgi:uncharacterized protein (DUF433 family)